MKQRLVIFSILFLFLGTITIYDANASPIFFEQYLDTGSALDEPDGYLEDETNAVNLEEVYYKSDGSTLDATFITHGSNGILTENTISYGMLIDSDANYKTGIRGFDYKYHKQWNNNTWYEIYEALPSYKKVSNQISKTPIKNPFNADDSSVHLNLDLNEIGNPQLYNIVFFTQGYLNSTLYFHDVTSLALIPPPNFSINVLPAPLDLISGTSQPIRIMVDSELQDHTDIYQHVRTDSEYVTVNDIIDSHIFLQKGHAEIPVSLEISKHDNILYHDLFIDLGPWYPTNPNEEFPDIEDPIIRSYDFRNKVDNITLKLLLVSLPTPPLDPNLMIQFTMLIFTIVLASIGIYSIADKVRSANVDKQIIHSKIIGDVFEIMLSLVCQRDYRKKELVLRYPEKDDNRSLVKQKFIDPNKDGKIHMLDFNIDNIPYLGRTLQHLDSYKELKSKWQSIQKNIDIYNQKSQKLKEQINKKCLESLQKSLPEFKLFTGQSGKKMYFFDSVAFECYNSIEMAIELGVFPVSIQVIPPDNERIFEYQVYADSQIFESDEPPDEKKINEVLGSCVTEDLPKQYETLMELHKTVNREIDIFVLNLDSIVKDLKHGTKLVQGKCDNEHNSILKFFYKKL